MVLLFLAYVKITTIRIKINAQPETRVHHTIQVPCLAQAPSVVSGDTEAGGPGWQEQSEA